MINKPRPKPFKPRSEKPRSTSWEPVEKWYKASVGDEGHYYHQQIIMPGVLRLMQLDKYKKPSVLDLACGQGVLSRHLPDNVRYLGLDLSVSLIKSAVQQNRNSLHTFSVADVSKPISIKQDKFSHAAIILALQNIEHADQVMKNAYSLLEDKGQLLIVLNHPCFRIPRQSSWQIDESKKIQYRRVDRYASDLKIPIQAHPSKGEKSPQTWTFHHPLSAYCQWLHQTGFVIETIEEWCSEKVSTGSAAKMENRARSEFPLFLTIAARKIFT
jgi:ubiquinone/menaquinone biosynthesis C-methylase UbiE